MPRAQIYIERKKVFILKFSSKKKISHDNLYNNPLLLKKNVNVLKIKFFYSRDSETVYILKQIVLGVNCIDCSMC